MGSDNSSIDHATLEIPMIKNKNKINNRSKILETIVLLAEHGMRAISGLTNKSKPSMNKIDSGSG